jgi:hypothetical protein
MANGHYRGLTMLKLLKTFIIAVLALLCLMCSWLSVIVLVEMGIYLPLLNIIQ